MRKRNKHAHVRVTITITEDLLRRLDSYAWLHHMTRSRAINEILRGVLEPCRAPVLGDH